MSMSENITAIVPTSPIPSHPRTDMIQKAILSVRLQLPNCHIQITADGEDVETEAYREYKDRLISMDMGAVVTLHQEHIHQSGMLCRLLPSVIHTPLILYFEHDWELLPDIPWAELSQLIFSGEFNYIKLHAAPRISPYHEHLMIERVMYQNGVPCDRYIDNRPGKPIPMIDTRQWSQNPHLASTEFYRTKIAPMCEGKTDFIENIVHGVVANSPMSEFKCGIYNPASGDMMRVRHLDGRNSQ